MSKLARAATYLERYAQEIEAAHTIGSRWDKTEARAEHDELLELAAALRAEPERKVAGLVEALVEALELARRTLAMAGLEGEVTRRIDTALAAHRKQEGNHDNQ